LLIDGFSNYKVEKIKSKIPIRTGANSIGEGEEAYLRYWVWQRKKRKLLVNILWEKYPNSNAVYPKKKWKKLGKVKFPLRREIWMILK
jgi:hypothetical protein